ncbi:Transmembrane transport protein [Alloactinosynnema sp. L-07]|uniref:MFS transporter n=1 Tax=Alloactinosynnema sp. L-07 TaxID=1653480 RepID=UPI00065EF120|nr:MFS transporter [Alloactinosynnema sp. L-07]CRK59420.1 Transmembrane transport protein [Alloactinosynnema sp. L-07]
MHTSSAADQGERAGRREMVGLAVLALPTILLALDMSVLYLALPHLGSDLGADSVQQLWIIDIYGFMIAGLLVTMGRLGDLVGRRRLLLIGSAAFAVASILAAYSTDAEMLIAARALLGIAGSTLMPSTLSLLTQMFKDPKQQAMAIGVWMGCFLGGTIFGPIIGGVMLEYFWWGSVFLLALPVAVLLLAIGPKTLPEYRNPDAGRIDMASVGLSLAGILPFIYGLKEISRNGPSALAILAVVVGVVFGALFLRRQRALPNPLLDLRLFRDRTFSAAITMTSFSGLLSGAFLFVYMYLQLVEELPPLKAALWMIPMGLTTLVSLQVAPVLARRFRPGYVMAVGLLIVAAGYVAVAQVGGEGDLGLLVGGLVAVSAGIGPAAGLAATLVMGSVSQEKSGSAAAVNETSAEFGVAMGVAVIGMLGMSVYRGEVSEAMPSGLPADVAEAARESAAGAATAVRQLDGQAAVDLTTAAHNALASALNSTAWVTAAVTFGLAILAATALRHVLPTGKAAEQPAVTESA